MKSESTCPFIEDIAKHKWTENIRLKESLSGKTSVRVGGPAKYFQVVHNQTELISLLELIRIHNLRFFLIGKGTNLLVHDEGFSGIVIQLCGDFTVVNQASETELFCGAGVSNMKFSRFAKKKGLSGVEFLLTIPGTLGGALFMNAGAHGAVVCDIVKWVDVINNKGELKRYETDSSHFSYRHSIFMEKKLIILSAFFQLTSAATEQINEREKQLLIQRKKTQPINQRTWGSVFMNPANDSAGRLIEACGLKGKGVGKARISAKHANFIENTGGASFQDLMNTIDMARKRVREEFGIDLKAEGQILPKN